ncbi:MAG: hypothetical protein LBC69_03610 [Eubacteriaceae bacterium]|jgi:hypothetical protein|nr:hypothetical protein [Eubacteriaceae bacterium]
MRQRQQSLLLEPYTPARKVRRTAAPQWSAKKTAALACLFLALSAAQIVQRNAINDFDAGIQKLEMELVELRRQNDDLKGSFLKGSDLEAAERYAQSHGMVKATAADRVQMEFEGE